MPNTQANLLQGSLVKTITPDGLELAGFWVDRKSDTAVFHSHGTSGDFYTHEFIGREARELEKLGVSFLTANNRGHDVYADVRCHKEGKISWVQGGGAFEAFENCVLDISAWLDFLSQQGIKKVILQAHSLTQKILYYQHIKHDPRVIGQIHLSPCNDAGFMLATLGKEKYQETNTMITQMMAEHKEKELLPPELAVVCPMATRAYSGYLTEESVGNLFPYHDPTSLKWEILGQTIDPLLAIFGGSDGFIKPSITEAAKLFGEHAASARNKAMIVIPEAPHSYIGYEIPLVEEILTWISTMQRTQ